MSLESLGNGIFRPSSLEEVGHLLGAKRVDPRNPEICHQNLALVGKVTTSLFGMQNVMLRQIDKYNDIID